MSAIQIEIPPMCEPVALATAKNYLRVLASEEDDLIAMLLSAAREAVEEFTRRSFINKGYVQVLDSFPYYTDTVQSQQAYPPSYYSLPRYSTTLWNYSQMIKLYYSPLAAAPTIKYIATDGTQKTLTGTTDSSDTTADFWADTVNEPPRLFPKVGQYWPACLYHGNAVEIHFVAGYNNDAAIAQALNEYAQSQSPAPSAAAQNDKEAALRQTDPRILARAKLCILKCLAEWWENREVLSSLNLKELPKHLQLLLWSMRVADQAPTRG